MLLEHENVSGLSLRAEHENVGHLPGLLLLTDPHFKMSFHRNGGSDTCIHTTCILGRGFGVNTYNFV